MLILLSKLFIYFVLAASLAAAVGVVFFRNIFHAALSLTATLIGVAILYLALQAEFIAVVQILLYVGAVMTVIIFAIADSRPALSLTLKKTVLTASPGDSVTVVVAGRGPLV
jgi:NADH:ubiquinone oxidoreductase subunit 6 (subunit J)